MAEAYTSDMENRLHWEYARAMGRDAWAVREFNNQLARVSKDDFKKMYRVYEVARTESEWLQEAVGEAKSQPIER